MDFSPSLDRPEGRWKEAKKKGLERERRGGRRCISVHPGPLIDVHPPPLPPPLPKRSRSIMSCRSKDFPPLLFLLRLRHHHRSDQASRPRRRFRSKFGDFSGDAQSIRDIICKNNYLATKMNSARPDHHRHDDGDVGGGAAE